MLASILIILLGHFFLSSHNGANASTAVIALGVTSKEAEDAELMGL